MSEEKFEILKLKHRIRTALYTVSYAKASFESAKEFCYDERLKMALESSVDIFGNIVDILNGKYDIKSEGRE